MPGFFEAMAGRPRPVVKKHVVTIQGKEIEVDLAKKLEIQQAGEDKYMLENNEVVLRPKPKTNRTFSVLTKNDRGYSFYNGDPYWVESIVEEGYTWQIESE